MSMMLYHSKTIATEGKMMSIHLPADSFQTGGTFHFLHKEKEKKLDWNKSRI